MTNKNKEQNEPINKKLYDVTMEILADGMKYDEKTSTIQKVYEILDKHFGTQPAPEECKHKNIVSARNEQVVEGLYCPDCNCLFSEDMKHRIAITNEPVPEDVAIDELLNYFARLVVEELQYVRGRYTERYDTIQTELVACKEKPTDYFLKEHPDWIIEGGACDNAVYRLKQLEKELAEEREKHRWIPVSERLPKLPEGQGEYDTYGVQGRRTLWFTNEGVWLKIGSNVIGPSKEITHWKPPPDPPQEGEEGEG